MKMKILLVTALSALLTIFSNSVVHGQGMAVNISGAAAAASAMLDVTSTTAGVLLPRMTTAQMNAISSPATGLIIYNTTTGSFYYYTGSVWQAVGGGGSGTVTSVSSGNLSPVFTTSVSNATTTPAIAYTMSPSASYTVLTNSTNAVSTPSYGKVVPSALFTSSGTPSSSTFYRGDGQWQTPSSSGGFELHSRVSPGSAATIYIGAGSGTNPGSTISALVPADVITTAGTIDKFYINGYVVTTSLGSSNTATAMIYVNGASTGITANFTMPSSAAVNDVIAVVSAGVVSVAVNAGDRISIQWSQSDPGAGPHGNYAAHVHIQ